MKRTPPVSADVTSGLTIIEKLRRRKSYVGATEVMSIVGKSRKTLCSWIKNGTFPNTRLGKDNACDPALLANWLEARSTGC
jgi:hypothetical protein